MLGSHQHQTEPCEATVEGPGSHLTCIRKQRPTWKNGRVFQDVPERGEQVVRTTLRRRPVRQVPVEIHTVMKLARHMRKDRAGEKEEDSG